MIEVHLLRYALAAADSGSFSRAAEQFRVKQSTLSKRVRHLELRIGVPLFTRSTQGVAPTPSGIQFLARARSIVGELDMLSTDVMALASGERGRLRIGFHGTLAAGDLRATIEDFRREAPDVELEAIEAGRDQLLDGLDRGRLDLAVVAGEGAGGQALCLWSEPLAVGLSLQHRLLERDRLYWTDLREMTFLVTRADPGDLIAAMIAARLAGPCHAPRIVAQAVSRDNLHSLITRDRVSVTAGAGSMTDEGVAFREVHDAFGPTRLSQTLHWREENENPALARFLALAARRYGRAPPERPVRH
ncbi:LysR family transcriptional regulator [Sphingomonas sp. HF-S4]|uniref:LysR family transcriptional regulator n=1 Tax=Sphingomonas agrestis TaxID=3080540 RepID=A0ABU3YA36_9SPHN|nr:LysR family transcriptional regulator [Sphingomonas sp. HF-S4]MDV3458245.1 LysR family transcriptional regulator [Sphingomonas sp. HF-S4]